MIKLEIIIRPSLLDKMRDALSGLNSHCMNYTDILGFGRQHGPMDVYRGLTVKVDFLPKIKIEVFVNDEALENVIETVMNAARTGHIGDGKIFVSDVVHALRIRTGECDEKALWKCDKVPPFLHSGFRGT